jgi:hypothetical protein
MGWIAGSGDKNWEDAQKLLAVVQGLQAADK